MKFILETEYEDEHLTALNGYKYRRVLQELVREMDSCIDINRTVSAETWKDKVFEILRDENLELYD